MVVRRIKLESGAYIRAKPTAFTLFLWKGEGPKGGGWLGNQRRVWLLSHYREPFTV